MLDRLLRSPCRAVYARLITLPDLQALRAAAGRGVCDYGHHTGPEGRIEQDVSSKHGGCQLAVAA